MWQPIETAPKDGTVFLARWDFMAGIYAHNPNGVFMTNWTGWGGGCWEGQGIGRPVQEPDIWMPIPIPPAASL